MEAWRLCRARHADTALHGDGARRYGGRWNPVGAAVVYGAESLSLATLEALTGFSRDDAPSDTVSIRVRIPQGVAVERVERDRLPEDWRAYPAPEELAEIGRVWIESCRTAVLLVPSAVTPSEWNVLLNPAHPDIHRVTACDPEPFRFDPRILGDA